MLIQYLLDRPIIFVLWIVAIIFAITVHEFSHALSAWLQGDYTAESEGRLSLNPLNHIDWLGFVLLLFAGFGWAKPTPFNPYNLKYKKWGPALVALSGPAANVLIVVIIGTALRLLHSFVGLDSANLLVIFFVLLIQVNILLAVFNCLPIPPLDGSKVLYSFIALRRPDIVLFLEKYGMWFLLALVFFGSEILSTIFSFFYNLTFNIIF